MRSLVMFLLFVLIILLAITFAGIGIYYLIPGIYHILLFSISGNPYAYHLKHALIFFALAVLTMMAVRFVQPLPKEKIKTRPLAEARPKQKPKQRPNQSKPGT